MPRHAHDTWTDISRSIAIFNGIVTPQTVISELTVTDFTLADRKHDRLSFVHVEQELFVFNHCLNLLSHSAQVGIQHSVECRLRVYGT